MLDLSVNHLPKLVWSTMSRWSSTVVKALWHRPLHSVVSVSLLLARLRGNWFMLVLPLFITNISHIYINILCIYVCINISQFCWVVNWERHLCLPSSKPSPVLIWMTSHIQKETDWIYLKAIGKFHSLGHLLWFINCPGSDMDDLRHLLDQEHDGSWLAFPKNPTYPIQPNQGLNTRWTQRAW